MWHDRWTIELFTLFIMLQSGHHTIYKNFDYLDVEAEFWRNYQGRIKKYIFFLRIYFLVFSFLLLWKLIQAHCYETDKDLFILS